MRPNVFQARQTGPNSVVFPGVPAVERRHVDPETSPAPVAQNMPGTVWDAETGYDDASFPAIVNRGKLGVAKLARYSGVPTGVNLFARAVVTSGGVATLVYEILRADPVAGETVTVPIHVADNTPQSGLGAATVSGVLGPLTTVRSAAATAPSPRCVGRPSPSPSAPAGA